MDSLWLSIKYALKKLEILHINLYNLISKNLTKKILLKSTISFTSYLMVYDYKTLHDSYSYAYNKIFVSFYLNTMRLVML